MSLKHRVYFIIILCVSMTIALLMLDKYQAITTRNEKLNIYNRKDILQINKELKAAEIIDPRPLPSTLLKREEKAAMESQP